MDNNRSGWNSITVDKTLKYLLLKFFDLREGEYKRAFLMQLNIFLLISTLLIVKPSVNGLFLAHFGVENLPLAFVLVALAAMVLTFYYSRILIRVSFYKLMTRTISTSVVILLVFGILLELRFFVSSVIYLFYIWVALFAVLSASQFWILANLVFNVREAKRLFGFIGSGAIAGGIFGGYLTSFLAPVIGADTLLFVAAALLFLCIPITRIIWRENLSGKKNPFRSKNKLNEIVEGPLRLIRKSKHLTYLAGIIGTGVIVAKLVDYQFNAIASMRITNPDELTAFFGFWFSNFNLISLLIQLFLTRRVVGVFGVGTSLFVLPVGILIGALLVLFVPSLFAAIVIKMADGSLKQSINKSATELLALPIPLSIKNKTKTFIDVFVDSVATGIGGIILILLVNALQLSTPFISLMILAVLGFWFFFALKIRREYILSFQSKLHQSAQGSESGEINIEHESVLNGLINVLKSGTESQRLWVLEKIREKQDDRLYPAIVNLLENESGEVRAAAVQNLCLYHNKNIADKVRQMIADPVQEVKIAAFQCLLHQPMEDRVELMQQFLSDPDQRVNGAALLSLAEDVRDNPELKKQYELRQIVSERIENLKLETDPEILRSDTIIILETIGKGNMPGFYTFVEEGLLSDSREVRETAIRAAGLTQAPEFIDRLMDLLMAPNYSEAAQHSLAQYGIEITHFFGDILKDPSKIEIQRKIPGIVGTIESQHSVSFLFGLLDSEDTVLRSNALISLNRLKVKFPFLHFDKKAIIKRILEEARIIQDTLSMLSLKTRFKRHNDHPALNDARKSLIELLERRLDGSLERIFQLLGLKYPPEEISTAYKSYQSDKTETRISSIDFLDNLLDTRLKRVIIPILETTLLDTISEKALKSMNIELADEQMCYSRLLEGNDIRIKLAVLYLIAQMKDKNYLNLVKKYRNNSNQKVSDFAEKAFEAIMAG